MTDQGPAPASGPSVCPFVALAEDRDRRAETPDEGNRCYAEPAPRRRDLVYQADYCYSTRFASCSVFLAWAARNAAEPAYVNEAAQQAWRSGIAAPEQVEDAAAAGTSATRPTPTPEGGLFGPADPAEADAVGRPEHDDWISASAWAEVPWDEHAEEEAAELADLVAQEEDAADELEPHREEDTQAPKVPAALPLRRRKRAQPVISSRGSGEWYYADPPGHEPLVSRRTSLAPPIVLATLGLLVAALVVFMIPALLFGGGDDEPRAAAAVSPSPQATIRPQATRAPVVTAPPTVEPSAEPTPRPEFHTVKRGETLTSIAQRYGVRPAHLVCLNNIKNRNIVVLGATYKIPPEGFKCPPNWRNQN